jgi:exonuclease SbcD
VPSYPKQAGNTEERVLSIHDLQQIDPLDMIKRTYESKYANALPESLERLVSIVPSYPKQPGYTEERVLSIHDLQQIDPLDMIKRTYESKYANALPESLERLFREVEHEVQVKQD